MRDTSRREFLRVISVTASASALGLSACSSSSNSPDATPGTAPPAIVQDEARFPQGVASGDPRPNAVILWTRLGSFNDDRQLRLQVAADSGFSQLLVNTDLVVRAAHDHCVKVRVTGLQPGQTYHYRFMVLVDGSFRASASGRTRTARAEGDATPVRFAFISCQDFVGRFFNSLQVLLNQDLDFVVHLGDSIYETTGDPSFQGGNPSRTITFTQPEQALRLGSGSDSFFAARSLSNYRDLYRSYRADPALRALYQRFPLIAIWDDHEFSDDAWRDNGTYLDGRFEERDRERRRNAEQAYFEYTPVDPDFAGPGGAVQVERERLHPNTVLFRKLRFGRDVELFLTDYRSYRPDHLIPEDAFPGTVIMDRAALTQVLALQGIPYELVRAQFSPYLDIDQPQYAVYKQVLQTAVSASLVGEGVELGQAALRAQTAIAGNLATTVINSLVAQFNAATGNAVPLLPPALIDTLDTGLAWFTLGKTSLFGDLGSRYFVVKDTYDLYAGYLALTRGAQTQDALGPEQTQWLVSQVAASTARWKIVATSVAFTSMLLDLRDPQLGVPAPFNQRFYLNVDQWDGFPQTRDALLRQALGNVPGVVFVSGDIHAGFVTTHPGASVTHAEFTTPAVSSTAFRELLANAAGGDPLLGPLAAPLLPAMDLLLRAANPRIAYTQTERHGVSVAECSEATVEVSMFEYAASRTFQSEYSASLAPTAVRRFRWNGSQMEQLEG